MNYPETLSYLYSRLPMFTRDGVSALKNNLTNTIELCRLVDNPQKKFKTVHVGGTNGKGSTSHMLAAILQTAGYKTGLYTSPHLKDFRERIRINGNMISEDEVVDFVADNKTSIEDIQPSFFEVTVAMAFDHFAKHNVDIAVIEVGLGGRLDSTNIITPILSIITNIGYDHMNILGNTLPEIAAEKAGIIKPRIPVVIGERLTEADGIFLNKAENTGSEIIFASDEWEIKKIETHKFEKSKTISLLRISVKSTSPSTCAPPLTLSLDLTGIYQLKNLKSVLSSVLKLQEQGFKVPNDAIAGALKQVKKITGLQGRWQILKQRPLIICDTGHNEDGIKEVLKNINNIAYNKLHMVIGMVKDKDISKILQLLPKDATYYFCHPDLPRAKPAKELAEEAQRFNLTGSAFRSVKKALQTAKKAASANDLIFVGGSTFVVAEIL